MPLYEHEKQARKPKTIWGKVQNVFNTKSSSQPVRTNHQRFLDHQSLKALQASEPKKSKGAAGQRPAKSGKKEQVAGLQHPEVQHEAADFLSSGAHYGPTHTKAKKAAAHDEALRKLTSSGSMRKRVKDDYKDYPTPSHVPSLETDVESYLRRQGSRQYACGPPPAPPPKPTKESRSQPPFPIESLRTVPKHVAELTRGDHTRHVSTAASPISPLTPNTKARDRSTKWEDFYAQVSPLTPLLPPMPTLPNAAKTHQHREELERKRRLVPQCQLCTRDAVSDDQVSKLGYALCKGCAKKAFYYPSPTQAQFPHDQEQQQQHDSPTLPRDDDDLYAEFEFDDGKKAQGHYAPTPPQGSTFPSTPWVESLRPEPTQNPLHPGLYAKVEKEHPLMHTYSTIFALKQAEPAPPVPALPSSYSSPSPSSSSSSSTAHHRGQGQKNQNQNRPLTHELSSTYSLALPPGTLPPSSFDNNNLNAHTAPLPRIPKDQKISTSTHLPAPSIPPLGPLPPISQTRESRTGVGSVYEPISWRSNAAAAAAETSYQPLKRKPVQTTPAQPAPALSDSTREAARSYGVKGPAPARSVGEEQWRRNSGFYEFWGEILGYETVGERRLYQQV